MDLADALRDVAVATGFSGVVRVDVRGETVVEQAFGLAHRGLGVAIEVGTRFGIASGTKGLTALVVASLVEQGALDLGTTARSVLGDTLPLVDEAVTVEHLLAHRSGIGDYLDESALTSSVDYVMPVPVHRLVTTSDYLSVLDGHPQQFAPGTDFAYNNGGFVVLALLAERVTGTAFAELVRQRVCEPAGMTDTSFPRGDEPSAGVALGYLEASGLRTNVLHLPVVGSGDGGAFSTAADVVALWSALDEDRVVSRPTFEQLTRPRSTRPDGTARYGLGFWLRPEGEAVVLTGADAGVSFQTVHDAGRGVTWVVLSNTTDGAWALCRLLRERVA